MKILHTADLHLGQILYQSYERTDEHIHFFKQLEQWCKDERPDALLVSGDIFDIQQPSNEVKELFNTIFVSLQKALPDMHIVITAGNHDSASRIHADREVWSFSNTHLVGLAPSSSSTEGWQDDYIIELSSGYIIAMPYMHGNRQQQLQSILDKVSNRNTEGKPVVMMGHLAVSGSDATGHDFEIGKIKTQNISDLGSGYDYLALGHIHKPQTIGDYASSMTLDTITYEAPVARYSGSALHVTCDEQYPHTVSVVEIDRHGGNVSLHQLRIDELRHFHILPEQGEALENEEDAIKTLNEWCENKTSCYIRFRMKHDTMLSPNFSQKVYDILNKHNNIVRYNPRILWEGQPESKEENDDKPVFELEEIRNMTDPIEFINKTKEQYPRLDFESLREVFSEVETEVKRIIDEGDKKQKSKQSSNQDQENAI